MDGDVFLDMRGRRIASEEMEGRLLALDGRVRKLGEVCEGIWSDLSSLGHGCLCITEWITSSLCEVGRGISRERWEFGFSEGEEKDEEEVFRRDVEMLEFLFGVLSVFSSNLEFLGRDFSGFTREWFLMEMMTRFGYGEEYVGKMIERTLERAVRERIGMIEVKGDAKVENCILRLLDVS